MTTGGCTRACAFIIIMLSKNLSHARRFLGGLLISVASPGQIVLEAWTTFFAPLLPCTVGRVPAHFELSRQNRLRLIAGINLHVCPPKPLTSTHEICVASVLPPGSCLALVSVARPQKDHALLFTFCALTLLLLSPIRSGQHHFVPCQCIVLVDIRVLTFLINLPSFFLHVQYL